VLSGVRELKEAGFASALDDVVAESDDLRKLQPMMDGQSTSITCRPQPGRADAASARLEAESFLPRRSRRWRFQQCMISASYSGLLFRRRRSWSARDRALADAIMNLLNLLDRGCRQREIERRHQHDALVT